jgi:hypothetical protein
MRIELSQPPVYVAIGRLCRIIGVLGVLLVALGFVLLGQAVMNEGWASFLANPRWLRMVVRTGLIASATASYFMAARLLRDRRGTFGLGLCMLAVGLTYLIFWDYSSGQGRPPIGGPPGLHYSRLYPPDHA